MPCKSLVEETRQVVVAAMESMPAGFAVPQKVPIRPALPTSDLWMAG